MWTPLRPSSLKNQGFVLVAVLMSVTVLVTGALAFAWFTRMELRRAEALAFSLQARSLAEAAIHEVRRGLVLDTNDSDSLHEPWFRTWPLPFGENISVVVRLTPQNDALPVNALFLPDGTTLRRELEAPWERLWEEIGRPELAAGVLDFLDTDRTPRPGGSEEESFINRPPSALEEIRLFPGIDENLYTGNNEEIPVGLERYLTVRSDGKINVNVALPQVLELLDPSLTTEVVREILDRRGREPLSSWDDLAGLPGFSSALRPRLAGLLSFTSSHFLAEVEVRRENLVRRFEAVLVKQPGRCTIVAWKEM